MRQLHLYGDEGCPRTVDVDVDTLSREKTLIQELQGRWWPQLPSYGLQHPAIAHVCFDWTLLPVTRVHNALVRGTRASVLGLVWTSWSHVLTRARRAVRQPVSIAKCASGWHVQGMSIVLESRACMTAILVRRLATRKAFDHDVPDLYMHNQSSATGTTLFQCVVLHQC